MRLLDAQLPDPWLWSTISARYRVTKKPRGLVLSTHETIPFVAMEAVPTRGKHKVGFELRSPANISSGTYFERGDVLLSKITPSFENEKQGIGIIPSDFGVGSTELIPFQAIDKESNNYFLFYYLLHPDVRSTLAGKMEGSTGRQRVPETAIQNFPLPNPPRVEQDKIASVLRKVQRAVEIEEKLIATVRELKQSAMHQLFTRGLRNESQKQTEIGLVPESWNIQHLSELVVNTDTVDLRRDGGKQIEYVDVSGVSRDTLTIISTQPYRLREAPGRARKRIYEGDVIFATVRPTLLRVARVASALNDQVCSTAFCVLRERDLAAKGLFILYLVQRPEFIEQLRRIETGASYPAVTDRQVKKQLVPVPDEKERKEIAMILQATDRKISIHERKRSALRELFKTLLHRLMTGEIRVGDLDIDTSEVTAC